MNTRSRWNGSAIAFALAAIAVGGLVAVAYSGAPSRTKVESRVTIRRPRMEVWGAWAPLVDLPRFLSHVERVEDLGDGRSRWVGKATDAGGTVEWIAEETERDEGRCIRWRTISGQALHQDGEIRFEDAPDGDGTVVSMTLGFEPTASPTQAVASFVQALPRNLAKNELKRFKSFVETGRLPERRGGRRREMSAEA